MEEAVAKIANRAVLRITRGHRPYAVSAIIDLLLP
jgi:hypothetical protein